MCKRTSHLAAGRKGLYIAKVKVIEKGKGVGYKKVKGETLPRPVIIFLWGGKHTTMVNR